MNWTQNGSALEATLNGRTFRVVKKSSCLRRWRVLELKGGKWIDINGFHEMSAAQRHALTLSEQ